MKSLFLIIALVFAYTTTLAHNPLSAKFELDATMDKGAILHIYLSQVGLHQALVKHYADKDFTTISPNTYKELAVQYIKNHTTITANQTLLQIGEGGIKLGNHQTDFKFLLKNYPINVNDLMVHINAFQENENHHTIFWWKRKNATSKVILSAKNDFKGTLNAAQQVMTSTAVSYKKGLSIGLGLMILWAFSAFRRYARI